MTQPNIPLLRKAVEWAEAEAAKPEIDCQWAQSTWLTEPEWRAEELTEDSGFSCRKHLAQVAAHCGTAYCIAGYVGQLLDARYTQSYCVGGVHVADFAAEALGLDLGQAMFGGLFSANNSIQEIRECAEEIAAKAGERL